ncbi:FAD-dependent tricarballylate dehydrogenase TcuA [Flavobacterium muglaense]|uniref:FAD-dependent tricarballylate dehydrogenase TcuA n=1 Tax=Flavobacterium muglaense TaxID=2764716 RepID=A0A923N1R5_9FLAO|nr:FAD-dependent tricarballylate dehydrogenase TcuA [Flavobacterium muglaense]MBC5838929.1 FAD-dependent tricarballylate dehydrogenase TcuA [Flavobacterium muglaense]MBC5845432.1 FAD-dependent tricarballylate dehydrogenase TcuA [Flavobacterium muglaense]
MNAILNKIYDVIIIGSGNAALCAGISALETNQNVLIIEKADEKEWGGNSRYTAGAMRFAYDSNEDLMNLLKNPTEERIANTDFGSYTKEKFKADLLHFNEGEPLAELQEFLVENSLDTIQWLASHNIKFDPIYSRQSFIKDGKYIFWGGLTLEAEGEGDGLVSDERKEFLSLGGALIYNCEALEIIQTNNQISGIKCLLDGNETVLNCKTVVLGCGGFESNKELREKYLGPDWGKAKVRGTRHNMGKGIEMAQKLGAVLSGNFSGCHAVPMDRFMPDYGNLNLPHIERKHYRKISYLFGIMLNQEGNRFVDEGLDFRNYTYAQFGKAVLEQPNSIAWQFFDKKNFDILYSEYKTNDASFYEADTIEALLEQIEDIDQQSALKTIKSYNASVDKSTAFDPTIKDGKSTKGLVLNKTNWATTIDQAPFRAYPVTAGITFTYGGLKVNKKAEVIDTNGNVIPGLYACGEMVGGLFFYGYPGGSGLTSGSLFGRYAGKSAAKFCTTL